MEPDLVTAANRMAFLETYYIETGNRKVSIGTIVSNMQQDNALSILESAAFELSVSIFRL